MNDKPSRIMGECMRVSKTSWLIRYYGALLAGYFFGLRIITHNFSNIRPSKKRLWFTARIHQLHLNAVPWRGPMGRLTLPSNFRSPCQVGGVKLSRSRSLAPLLTWKSLHNSLLGKVSWGLLRLTGVFWIQRTLFGFLGFKMETASLLSHSSQR